MAEIHCCLGNAAFIPGTKNLAFLYCNNDAFFEPQDWITSIEFHGHIVGNLRWLKDAKFFETWLSTERPPETILDQVYKLPIDPSLKEKSGSDFRRRCIFATAKITVSPIVLHESGLLVEIDLPKEMIPSYRGRSVQVNYYLTVSMEKSSISKRLHFLVPTNGTGSQRGVYHLQNGGIVAYPPHALPEEMFLDSSFLEITSDEIDNLDSSDHGDSSYHMKNSSSEKFLSGRQQKEVVYSVRDEGHICNISLPSLNLMAGMEEQVDFDFKEQTQVCYAVKASLRMIEYQFKSDNPTPIVVQEKELWEDYKLTSDVEFLCMHLYIPDDAFCSFSCPLIKLQYKLLLEFFLSPNSLVESLSFSIDLTVSEQVNRRKSRISRGGNKGVSNDMDKRAKFLSMLHTCLETNFTRTPYIEIDTL